MFHGIKVVESATGARQLATVATAVIGLVATGPAADAKAFPLDRPVLVTDIRDAIAKSGDTGTLPKALAAIADQATPILIVVRIDEGLDPEDLEANTIGGVFNGEFTGIQALLAAENATGLRPRILGAPGLDTQAVTEAMTVAAKKLRAFVYAAATGVDTAEAVLYRDAFSARELMLIWPDFDTDEVFPGDAVARAMGLRAKIDEQQGWHKTLSNVAVSGASGTTKDVLFDLQDNTTTAGVLNDAAITTIVRLQGFRFWGNRTTSDDPVWAFESRVRTAQVLQDTIAEGLAWAIDKPLNPQLVRDLVETINAEFRQLKAEGRITGAEVLPLDTNLNTPEYLAGGQLALDYEFTDIAPLESLTLNQRVTDRFYANFNEQLANL